MRRREIDWSSGPVVTEWASTWGTYSGLWIACHLGCPVDRSGREQQERQQPQEYRVTETL